MYYRFGRKAGNNLSGKAAGNQSMECLFDHTDSVNKECLMRAPAVRAQRKQRQD